MDTPEATKPRPAAVTTAPSNNKNAYIRQSPSRRPHAPTASHFSNYFGPPLPMAQALMSGEPFHAGNARPLWHTFPRRVRLIQAAPVNGCKIKKIYLRRPLARAH